MEMGHVIEVLVLGVTAVIGWIGRNQIARIDRLEANKADREDLADHLAEVRSSIEKLTQSTQTQHAAITGRLDTLLMNMLTRNREDAR